LKQLLRFCREQLSWRQRVKLNLLHCITG
jgi:hypothetical protein